MIRDRWQHFYDGPFLPLALLCAVVAWGAVVFAGCAAERTPESPARAPGAAAVGATDGQPFVPFAFVEGPALTVDGSTVRWDGLQWVEAEPPRRSQVVTPGYRPPGPVWWRAWQ